MALWHALSTRASPLKRRIASASPCERRPEASQLQSSIASSSPRETRRKAAPLQRCITSSSPREPRAKASPFQRRIASSSPCEQRHRIPSEQPRHGSGTASPLEIRPQALEHCLDESLSDSPQLPDDLQPLDYELLEYVDVLPAKVIERLASELQAREHLVTHLRASNDRLAKATARAAAAARRSQQQPMAGGGGGSQETASSAALAEVAALTAEASADAARCAKAMERAEKLKLEIQRVEEATDAELARIAVRIEAAERQDCQLAEAGHVEWQDEDKGRSQLLEAQSHFHRLRERASKLELTREQVERRARHREQESRLLLADREQLRVEVRGFRAQTAAFERAERQEAELQQELREAKAELRRISKAAPALTPEAPLEAVAATLGPTSSCSRPATPQKPTAVQRLTAAIAQRPATATSQQPAVGTLQSGTHPARVRSRRPGTPQEKVAVEHKPKTQAQLLGTALALGIVHGDAVPNVTTPRGNETSRAAQKFSPLGVCASRARSERSPMMSIPTPLRALASLVR